MWIGIAIGMVISFILFTTALIVVPKQKNQLMPDQLVKFWEASLLNQRNQFHAIASIADAIGEHNGNKPIPKEVKRLMIVGKEKGSDDGWHEWHDVAVQPTTNNEGVMVIHVK